MDGLLYVTLKALVLFVQSVMYPSSTGLEASVHLPDHAVGLSYSVAESRVVAEYLLELHVVQLEDHAGDPCGSGRSPGAARTGIRSPSPPRGMEGQGQGLDPLSGRRGT